MSLARQLRRATPLLVLCLLLSSTQMVVKAQQAAVGATPSSSAASSQQLADALSKAFGAVDANLTGSADLPAWSTVASAPETRAAAPGNPAVTAQSADSSAAGLQLLDAYQSLFSSVAAQDIGDGSNLANLQDAVVKLQKAYNALSGAVGPAAAAGWLQKFVGVEQLLLQTVGTQLNDLGLVAGLIALAAFIMVTVGGGLYIAGSATLLAVQIQALAATRSADGTDSNGIATRSAENTTATNETSTNQTDTEWYNDQWFLDAEGMLDDASNNVLQWAFEKDGADPLSIAVGLIDAATSIMEPMQQYQSNVQEARASAQQAVQTAGSNLRANVASLVIG